MAGNVTMRSLSPGERAGVRASVNTYSFENADEAVKAMHNHGHLQARVAKTPCEV